jgi:hypothetical protein
LLTVAPPGNEIFWDCGTLSACETLPDGLPLSLDDAASTDRHWRGRLQESSSLAHAPLSGVNDDSLEGFWSSSVLRYTQCDLTNQSDKSVAIWSIAKLVRDAWGDDYGAGVWGTALEEQLSWKVVDMKKTVRSVDLQWKQPSWSWTSVQGAVTIPDRVLVDRHYSVKDHEGRAISFRVKGTTRPMVEREHSDSIKEDVQLGWGEWQKRLESTAQARKGIGEARSQSMPQPVAQDPAAKPVITTAAPTTRIDPRDMEPELESKSIAVRAPLGSGSLHHDIKTGTYMFKIDFSTGSETNTPPEVTFEAFPDEQPTDLDLVPHTVHFLILTTTQNTTSFPRSGLGINFEEYDSDDEPELPLTYSGTGVLLTSNEAYLRRGTFRDRLRETMEKVIVFKGKSSAFQKDPKEAREAKQVQDQMDALMGLVAQLEKCNGTVEEGRHFRRTGVVEFRGLSEEVYQMIVGGEKVGIWVD